MTKKWNEVKQLVPQRDSTLQVELKKQQSNYINALVYFLLAKK